MTDVKWYFLFYLLYLKKMFLYSTALGLNCCRIKLLVVEYWVFHHMWDLSSLTRNQTHIHCIGRQILSHWTTKGVP